MSVGCSAPAAAQLRVPQSPLSIGAGDYARCHELDIAGVEAAIRTHTLAALEAAVQQADFSKVIEAEWRKARIDEIVDAEIDKAIEAVQQETSWLDRMSGLVQPDKAKELATAVAERTFRSDAVRKGLEQVSGAVGGQIGGRIEIAAADAAGPAARCLREHLGSRYGREVARVVGGKASLQLEGSVPNVQGPSGARVLLDSGEGLAGVMVLIVRRQLSRLAARVGERVVGAVLSRVVSVVAGGVGLVLIAKDIWDLRNGVMPIIAEEMRSNETKAKVREELAKAVSEQMRDGMRDIAGKAADSVTEVWRKFRADHASVLAMAERHGEVRAFLDAVRPDRLARVDELIALVLAKEGVQGVLARIADGTLRTSVDRLDADGLAIARDTGSLAAALAWTTLAGSDLSKVVALELHRRTEPGRLTREGLGRLLKLEDGLAIATVLAVPPVGRDRLLQIEPAALRRIARTLEADRLTTLARYLTGLDAAASQRLLASVGDVPARMARFGTSRVEAAIFRSRDQLAAVEMILAADRLAEPREIVADIRTVLDGKVDSLLLWDRHPIAIGALALVALLLLSAFWRMLFGRRRGDVRTDGDAAAERAATRAKGGTS